MSIQQNDSGGSMAWFLTYCLCVFFHSASAFFMGNGNEDGNFSKNHCGMEMLCILLVIVDALQMHILIEYGM